jgi:DNA sulfur modification protein DndD
MRILSVNIKDFRSFFGEHFIELSSGKEKPVTIIIGENGGGKTNLLNAIYWTYTGGFTPKFEDANRIINTDALKSGVKECFVELVFEHLGSKHVARRTANTAGRSWIELWPVDGNGMQGAALTEERAEYYLKSVLPKHLANWFIFDGEAVGKIDLTGSTMLKESLYQTFGFKKIAEVITTLNSLAKEYTRDISSHVKSERLNQVIEDIDNEENRIEKYVEELKTIEIELEERSKAEEEYSKQLGNLDKSSKLERKKSLAEGTIREQKNILIDEEAKRNVLLRKSAPCVVLKAPIFQLISEFRKIAKSQDIPSPLNEILVNRILSEKLCICKRPVLAGTAEEATIRSLMDSASTQAMTFRLQELNKDAHTFKNLADNYFEVSAEINKRIAQCETIIDEQTLILKEIEKELDGIDEKEVSKLRDERRNVIDRIAALNQRKGNLQSLLRQSKEAKQKGIIQRDTLVNQLGKNDSLIKEKVKLEKLRDYVEKRFEQQESEVLEKLSTELTRAVDQYLVKNYQLEIRPDTYQIITRDIEGREKTLTVGEKQTITFAFVAAIVGMASSNTRFSNIDWIAEPVTAPLILDAPFSVQDELYRSRTARNIAEQSDQCVLMFDGDKWRGNLADALKGKVGKFYTLITCARGPEKDALKSLTIGDKKIPLNRYQCDRDESQIQEVNINA